MDAAAGSGGEHSLVKFNTGGSAAVSTRIASVAGMLRHMVSRLVLWRKRSSVSPVYTKRRLVRSHTTAVSTDTPFSDPLISSPTPAFPAWPMVFSSTAPAPPPAGLAVCALPGLGHHDHCHQRVRSQHSQVCGWAHRYLVSWEHGAAW